MFPFLKKIGYLIVTIFMVALTATLCLWIGLNTTKFYEVVLPAAIKIVRPQWDVKGLAVQTAQFEWPGNLKLGGVELAFQEGHKRHHAVLDRIELGDLLEFLKGTRGITGELLLRSYQGTTASLRNVIVDFEAKRATKDSLAIEAVGILGELVSGGYVWNGLHFDVAGTNPRYEIRVKEGKFYGGAIRADITYQAAGRGSYSGTVVLDDIATDQLVKVFPYLERDVKGVISGDVYMEGDSFQMQSLEINLTARKDMYIRADLVGWIVLNSQMNEGNAIFRMMRDEIRKHEMMQYHAVDMSIQNEGQHHIRITMNMKTRKHTFVVNPTIDIHSDGDLLATIKKLDFGLKRGFLENLYVRN